jgi:hypothetical protein
MRAILSLVLLCSCSDDSPAVDSGPAIDASDIDVLGTPDAASSSCCVVLDGLGGGTQSFCADPAAAAATPTITWAASGITLRAAQSALTGANEILVIAYGANDAGDYANPMVEYYDPDGNWYENNAMDGLMHIDAWPTVGEEVTGTVSGTVYRMEGSGPESFAVSGTYCAVRAADR